MKNIIAHVCSPGSMLSKDFGLLLLRTGVGAIFVRYGFEHMRAGTTTWHWLGSQMALIGINFAPAAWGLLAACSEGIGGLLCIIGFKTRIATFFISAVMLIALVMHIKKSDNLNAICLPLSLLISLLTITIAGAGRFSIDYLIVKMWC